jgi:outer membrane protein TolC
MALENNPSLKVEKIRVEQARSRIDGQKGEYNYLFNATGSAFRKDNIVASRFYPTGLYNELQKAGAIGVETKTRTGGKVTLGINYADLRSSSNTQTLSPQYSANLSFGISHSLLRDFGRSISDTRIRIAEKGATIAEGNLFTRISQLIQRVEETYWNLSFTLKDLEGKQRSLESAKEFLTQNENLFRAGRIAQVNVLQARAAVAERDRDVITSQSIADELEDRLKNLLWLDLNAANLTPADQPDMGDVLFDVAGSITTALQLRPELRALQRELEQRDIELKYAANQKRPRLDLNAQLSLAGLSGHPNPTCVDPTSIICTPVGSNVSGSILANKTGVRDAFSSLVSHDPFDSWTVELKFQLPIGNQTAEAQYTEASLKQLESKTNLSALKDQIAIEVREAIRQALAARKRTAASREAVLYVEDQLDGMRRQLDAGLVSSYDVLKAFDEVDKARTTELQAMMDFNVALGKIRLAEASGLQRYNVDLASAPRYTFR